jgi:hypothetical protein
MPSRLIREGNSYSEAEPEQFRKRFGRRLFLAQVFAAASGVSFGSMIYGHRLVDGPQPLVIGFIGFVILSAITCVLSVANAELP